MSKDMYVKIGIGVVAIVLLTGIVKLAGRNKQTAAPSDADLTTEIEEIYNSTLKMDTHLHVDVPMTSENVPWDETIDLRAAMAKAGLDAVGMTFAVDYVQLDEPGEAYTRFHNAMDGHDKILAESGLTRTLDAEQMIAQYEAGEPIVIQEIEGAHFLEGDVSRLQEAYDRGVRILDLFHDNDADPALGDVYTNAPVYGGLTEIGRATIQEAERLGMLVDLAHADDNTVSDALEVATKPILISHTGLNTQLGNDEQMAQMMYPRLISPEMAKKVADADGVIGIWPHLADSPAEYAAHVKAMVDIVGADHVTIGTDSKITKEYNEFEIEITPEMREQFGGDDGEDDGRRMPVQNLDAANHVWTDVDDSFYHSVITELVKVGLSAEDIAKICGGNFVRVFAAATNPSES